VIVVSNFINGLCAQKGERIMSQRGLFGSTVPGALESGSGSSGSESGQLEAYRATRSESAQQTAAEAKPLPVAGLAEYRCHEYPYSDPRPDLKEDSLRWDVLLWVAYGEDKPGLLFGFLHGLRCGGATLAVVKTRRGEQWKLAYKPALEGFSSSDARRWEGILKSHAGTLLAWLQESVRRYKEIDRRVSARREMV
jgi:hypothetical protein